MSSEYDIKRYPPSANTSLRAWSAVDEYLIREVADSALEPLGIYGDRFGYLACYMAALRPSCIVDMQSSRYAIIENAKAHHLAEPSMLSPLEPVADKWASALLRIPKSVDLYHLYLRHIVQYAQKEITVYAGFMTKHFTPQWLEIAKLYFEEVEQSRAWKKSRIIRMKGLKAYKDMSLLHEIPFGEYGKLQQYWGVFSAKQVDWATQFLLQHIQFPPTASHLMDLACGNGVIARYLQHHYPSAQIDVLDDSFLAIASARLNVTGENIAFHHTFHLDDFPDGSLDGVVSNPPFHTEYEVDISLPFRLFQSVARCLSPGGEFQLVANRHLNYKTQLRKWFSEVHTVADNGKFVVYRCVK